MDGAPMRRRDEAGRAMVPLVVTLFFAWGFATVLVDTLIPKLKALFALSYAEAMLTQFSFFIAYLLVSVPAGYLVARAGFLRGIVAGLFLMASGCLLFLPAVSSGLYPGFLLALFVMAAGITILQVSANPLIAVLGAPERSHSRLTLAQAFNSLGTTLGPPVGAALILAAGAVETPFLGIACGLFLLVLIFWRRRGWELALGQRPAAPSMSLDLLRHRRLTLGALSIFLYVGAEVSIGSLLVSYLSQGSVLGIEPVQAGRLLSLYWGGAMAGRFLGAAILRRFDAGAVLALHALGAAALALLSAGSAGWLAGAAILAVGLCNSIMFPTIFCLAIDGLGVETPQGSGLLCLAIVGGAVVPVVTGTAADAFGLSAALLVPAACYGWIAAYGLLTSRLLPSRQPTGAPPAR